MRTSRNSPVAPGSMPSTTSISSSPPFPATRRAPARTVCRAFRNGLGYPGPAGRRPLEVPGHQEAVRGDVGPVEQAAVLAVLVHAVFQDFHAEVMDVAVGVDPGQGVVGADDGRDAHETEDRLPLELLEEYAQSVALERLADPGELGVEAEVGDVAEADLLVGDADETVAEPDQARRVDRETSPGDSAKAPMKRLAPSWMTFSHIMLRALDIWSSAKRQISSRRSSYFR